jgi:hypothetical protein
VPRPRREWFPEASAFTVEQTPTRQRRNGRRAAVIAGFRNGLPELEKPYAYRGTGEDVMAGSYGDPLLDAPYDF